MNSKSLVKSGYNRMVSKYLAERDKLGSGKYVRRLLKLLPKQSMVLDVGCGDGGGVDETLIKAGHKVVGIDIAEKMIQRARRRCPAGEYFVKDMEELKECQYRVNAVVSFYAIFHLPRTKHERLLRVLVSYLSKGGYLLITMGDKEWEGEHDLYGERMWSSHWSPKRNRELVEKVGCRVMLDEIDRSGGEAHQVILAVKSDR